MMPCPRGQQNSATSVHADNDETIIVTATYEPLPLKESDRSVDVLPVEDLNVLLHSWADALREDPAIDLGQRAPGTQADISMRGGSFGQTLILVDGIRVNEAQSGHHNLDLPIPLAAVGRIEVLHGSGSTLYGSDAVGGAVNFITAAPVSTELRLAAGGGNFGSNNESGTASLLARRWTERLSFTRDFSSGFMPDRDYRNFAAASGTRVSSSWGDSSLLLGLSDRPFGADQFYGNFNSWERTKGWLAAAKQQFGGDADVELAYRRHTDEFILLRDQPAVYENNHATESWQAAVRERARLSDNNRLFYGAEFFRDSIDSNNLGRHARQRGAAYLDLDARAIGRFSLSLGGREEAFAPGNAVFSPSVSGGYAISEHLRLRASLAHAYRLPSYTDLYYSDPGNIGNPNLRPEKAWGYEAGISWELPRVSLSATLFERREHDVIDYIRDGASSVYRAANIQSLRFTGVELLAHLKLLRSQFDFGYTSLYGAQRALAGEESKYVFNYPTNQASVQWLGSTFGKVSARVRAGITQPYRASAYPLVELSLLRRFGRVTPYLQMENLTNTGYEEIQGVRMPGRSYSGGLEIILWRR